MSCIDLNADVGEGMPGDAELMALISSASVACGGHAGDQETMAQVCHLARRHGVRVGAHVSYPDRVGFGRRQTEVAPDELSRWVSKQIETLRHVAADHGVEVSYVKPHGALYNRVVIDRDQAAAVLAGSGDLPVLTLPGAVMAEIAQAQGRRVILEGFPDRGYTDDGQLIPRDQPGALVAGPEQVAAQAVELVTRVDSLCLHGDSPGAAGSAGAVREALINRGFTITPWVG